ncbi:glycosyltransferase [Stieleria sp. ICT_E10.1]|uniref:glycosyltransferase n=1 Tax=Stieleria sedimenti TaxID=2976331 RepID=UPI0021804C84|nr:glycosyltransferase [Stieleria sedimenti]MCS7465775.1 glycosyltransferase [Stieleria sedimenti]
MKILQVVSSMDPKTGGVCQGIRNTLPATESMGCHSDVVCLDESDATYEMADSFRIFRLGSRRGPWSYSRHLHRWLIESLPKYDAVVTNGLWLYHSFAVTRAVARLKRTPSAKVPRVFVMPHGMLDPWFQRARSRRFKAYRNWVYWKAIENRVISQADGMLFTCQRELELAREAFRPYRPKREINIGYGVPSPPAKDDRMDAAFRQACPALENQPYLLFLSRIHPKKGVDLLLQAYAKVAADESARRSLPSLVIAGPNDSAYAMEMRQLAEKLGLCSSGDGSDSRDRGVFFPGMLRGDAKWGAFYGCEAFVLPSHQENFGIAVVEALACGKPVLVSDQVNIWKEISDSNAGIARPDSLDGTRQLLEAWLDRNSHPPKMMVEDCLSCFGRFFSPQTAAHNLVRALAI